MPRLEPRPGVLDIVGHMADLPNLDGVENPRLLASNECALGPSPMAVEAARAAASRLDLYPEEEQDKLRTAIAGRFGLDPERIVCGHGSDDLLARVARAYLRPGDELVYSARGYQKIPKYALCESARPVPAPDRDLLADVDAILAAVGPRTRIVMLANPDNPSGCHLPGAEVRRLHAGLPDDVLLVLDSAYAEYARADDYEVPDRLVEKTQNVVMTRTFSKIFGLAGARLGWAYGPPPVIDVLGRVGVTFPVSAPSAAAGLAALEDRAFTEDVRGHNNRWLDRLPNELHALGLYVYPSETNFVLVRFDEPGKSAAHAYGALVARGIVPRCFTSRDFADHIRITIGPDEDLEALVAALRDFFNSG